LCVLARSSGSLNEANVVFVRTMSDEHETLLTGIMRSFVVLACELWRVCHAPELPQSVVGDLKNPSAVDDTVA